MSSSVRMPQWMRRPIPSGGAKEKVETILSSSKLSTVCDEAACPNRSECFCNGTATFLIMGEICTRHCAYCSVKKGVLEPLDTTEPQRLAQAVAEMKLRYVVITSVTRDDVADGGASHIAECVQAIKNQDSTIDVEVLIPDFKGNKDALSTVLLSGITVLNHNIEMPGYLFKKFRHDGSYENSLTLLRDAHTMSSLPVKSGFMVGLGEEDSDIYELLDILKECGVSIVTIGQYLRPSKQQAPVKRYVTPDEFAAYKKYGESIGIDHVEAGPFVRSSYNAAEIINKKLA